MNDMAKRLSENDAEAMGPKNSLDKDPPAKDSQAVDEPSRLPRDDINIADNQRTRVPFPVVGIVASAGGLKPFKSFFAAMPIDSGMAFVLVPHLDASHKSSMVELLARETSMPVIEVVDGQIVEVNSIYIIPPNRCLVIEQGKLRLSDLPNPIGAKTAIDSFLRSLAIDQEELAIGIVLSGTGSHGTLGLREIKRCGGMAMVQSPESAEFDQMPRSAIETGVVDFVLPPELMPPALLNYVQQPYVNRSRPPLPSSGDAVVQLKAVLELMRTQTKHDFRSYRPKMILRRIERRMGLVQLNDLAQYIDLLKSQPAELDLLRRDLLIGVTSFFREPEAFAVLETELFPVLIARHSDDRPLRVWIPSCATGEEAYTIAMLLFEAFEAAGKPANIQIFASDINQQSINIARRGVYPASIASDLTPARLQKFFLASDEIHYQVSKQLRDAIVFSKHNVISDAPFSKVDLISCRNLLIYLEPDIQERLISLFHYALVEDGHLLLGAAETIGRAVDRFETVSKKWRVYRRTGPANQPYHNLPIERLAEVPGGRLRETPALVPRKSYKELTEITLRDYTPAAVLINHRYDVLYVSGTAVDFLEFPTGELTKNLLAMARAGLRTRLRAACHQAISQGTKVVDRDARVQRGGVYISCTITACLVAEPSGKEGLVLVVFQDRSPDHALHPAAATSDRPASSSDPHADSTSLVQLLENELKSTRDELQSSTEEMESFNEELQSSNEELESAKEELQSLNEELSTVNCQLLEKVSELDKSNSEIINLMASTEIAALYVDTQLRIKRFTHPAVALFNLLPVDEGRDIRDFASPVIDYKLPEECQQVLQSLQVVETEILTKDNRSYLRRILPFRTPDHGIDGVVITFIDLTARNRAAAEQREREACLDEIFDHAATGIAIASLDGVFVKCNPAFCKLIGYSEEELRSIHFLSLVHPDDRSQNEVALQSLQSGDVSSYEIENRYSHKQGTIVAVRKFVSILPDGSGKASLLLALVTDITAQRHTLDALRQSEERIRTILKTASDAIITIDNQGVIDSVNQSTEAIFGYMSSELVGHNVSMLMPLPFSREHDGYIQRFLKTGEAHIIGLGREVICRRKDGSTFPADLAVSQVDHLGLFTGILRDVSSLKEMQRHILEIATDEQRRIGLELHDGTQQELTGLSLYANALRDTIRSADKVESSGTPTYQFNVADFERLQHTAALLTTRLAETNEHVRDLAHGIMPVQIDAEGLRSALFELADSISSHKGIECSFEYAGEVSIPDNTTATHLYRIAQEAVTNALRHGSADRIRIFLSLQDDRIALEISDNGVGFDSLETNTSALSSAGMGMRTMKYRASLIGGRVQVEQSAEGGTLIRCELLTNSGGQHDG